MININETPPPTPEQAATPPPTKGEGFLSRVKKVFKWLIIIAVALAVLGAAGTFGYLLYSDAQANKALTLRTTASDWQWQRDRGLGNRRSSDVQWRIYEEEGYVMRRVYDDHKVYTHLRKTDDGAINLIGRVWFLADCEEGTSIETSATYSDGTPFTLGCFKTDWGNQLRTGAGFSDVDVDDLPSWSKNYEGFEVDESFSYPWDFQPAVRHLTLQSAKPTEETEQ